MSADSNPTEVFADVEPDPDAVLAEFDVESPADLVDSAGDGDGDDRGAHDPTRDDELDVDDTTAAELFADLAAVDAATDADADAESDGEAADEPAAVNADDRPEIDPVEFDLEPDSEPASAPEVLEFVGDTVATVRSDGDVIESTAAELGAVAEPGTGIETATGTGTDSSTDDSSAALTVRTDTADELELVGEPTSTRVANDAFGSAGASAR